MNTDQLDEAVRRADPPFTTDGLLDAAALTRVARARAESTAPTHRRARVWVAVGTVAVVAVAAAIAVPVLSPGSAPTARAAIRLVAFDGLQVAYALYPVPTGLGSAGVFGAQGVTTTTYQSPDDVADSVYVSHTVTTPPAAAPQDVPGVSATRHEPDGSYVTVTGYGSFATTAAVTAAMATARSAPDALPLTVTLAPSGWQVAAFKDLQPGAGVVTLTPTGDDPGGPDAISVVRYPDTAADFPAGYQGQGPTSALTSAGRPGILMQGCDFWALQLTLGDGGSLVLLLPTRMTRDQVRTFADSVRT